jgi:ribonuclease P protein component
VLQKENRLTRKRDFEILFKEGRFVPGTLTTMKYWKVQPDTYPKRGYITTDLKIGFIVSTKFSKKAVDRNRAKRQMREVVRLLLKENKIPAGYMIAIMVKNEMLGKEYGEIEKSVVQMFKRANLLN